MNSILYYRQKGKVLVVAYNERIDRTLLMTSDDPTNAGKRVTSNIASARNQRYTKTMSSNWPK